MKCQYRFLRPPVPLRRATLDNLAIVPGNLLPHKAAWQEVANRLPNEAILIMLPTNNAIQKQTLLTVAKLLSKEGHQVRVVSSEEVARTDA
ncbi:MAG: hypothetical protein JOZ41_20715 [Chloroflexi bacterium]|nr:hypothetical protein [Chloroflexota bacterium]